MIAGAGQVCKPLAEIFISLTNTEFIDQRNCQLLFRPIDFGRRIFPQRFFAWTMLDHDTNIPYLMFANDLKRDRIARLVLQYEFTKLALESRGFVREIFPVDAHNEIVDEETRIVCRGT